MSQGSPASSFEIGAWIAAIVTGVVAVFQMYFDRRQRVRDLRWRQADTAKDLVEHIMTDPQVKSALLMLDWSGRKFEILPGDRQTISREEVERGLRTVDTDNFTDKEAFIRDCFDRLFDALERIEQAIRIEAVHESDVLFVFDYYVQKLRERPSIQRFLDAYGFELAKSYLARSTRTGTKENDGQTAN